MPTQSDTVQRLNTALAGRYLVDRELARGGMATVYIAEDVKHRRSVAVKVFGAEVASALGADRFLQEIDVAARLNHPHILALYDSGSVDGFLFYVMPYVRGESLRQLLLRKGQLPVDDAVRLARDVASALDYAHANSLVHRDIKPENILIHEGEAMVMDFGIARALSGCQGETLTRTGLIVGTAAYMSPEQAAGDELDERSDVYSLGCVLYEMLAGEPPFTAPTAAAMLRRRFSETAPLVRRVRPDVPASLETAIARALASTPEGRHPSAAAFASDLGSAALARAEGRTVAVLPFLNLGSDPDNEYFADGITEDVIAQLSKLPALRVISRASVMRFKSREAGLPEIATQLGASVVLDGSVRRAGQRVRIVAQLIDAATDQHLWAETYDRDLIDIFAIQSDVALQIATALQAGLTADERSRLGKPPTDDLDAYQLYLQGRHCVVRFTTEGMRKGIGFFDRAIGRDPDFALAYAGIAMAYLELGETGSMNPLEAFRRAQEVVDKALERDPNMGDVHGMNGQLKVLRHFDWPGAEAEFKLALTLNPSSADTYDFYGRMCAALERYDEALTLLQRAKELDPMAHRSDLSTLLLRAGRYPEALAAAKAAVDFDPLYDRGVATLGWAYLKNDMPAEGIAALERAVALSPGNTGWLGQLGEAYALAGRPRDARRILDRLNLLSRDEYVSPYHIAYIHTGLGELEAAIDWLDRAFKEQSGAVYAVKSSFLFAPLRGHPRFLALLRKMNLQ